MRRTENCTRPIDVQVRAEYSETVGDLTRRFFHYLVRHQQLVKGFQLAVDVDEYDLFMDIHHAAVRRNVPDLAHAALIKVTGNYLQPLKNVAVWTFFLQFFTLKI